MADRQVEPATRHFIGDDCTEDDMDHREWFDRDDGPRGVGDGESFDAETFMDGARASRANRVAIEREARVPAPLDVEPDATWAHVFLETEMEEPASLDDATLAEVNEAISDIVGGRYFLQRCWISPGPLLSTQPSTQPAQGGTDG